VSESLTDAAPTEAHHGSAKVHFDGRTFLISSLQGRHAMKPFIKYLLLLLAFTVSMRAQETPLKDFKGDSTHYAKYDVAPKPVRQIMPAYPDSAKTAGIEGLVYVELYVNEQGAVKKVNVLKSSNPVFNDAALQAARGWEFTPASNEGKPVAAWIVLPFKFKLGDGTK
jgi:TonB family protein